MIDLLKSHGWKEVRRNNEKIVFLRPGNTESKSSGDFNFGLGWFSVFTTSTEFIPHKASRGWLRLLHTLADSATVSVLLYHWQHYCW